MSSQIVLTIDIINTFSQESDNLLVSNPTLKKDIVFDLLGALPNVIMVNIGTNSIVPQTDEDNIITSGSVSTLHGFDVHNVAKRLFAIYQYDLKRQLVNENGDIIEDLPSIKRYNIIINNNAFGTSIQNMIVNYYKNMENVTCDSMILEAIEKRFNLSILNLDEIIKEYPFAIKYINETCGSVIVLEADRNTIQMSNTALINKVLDFIKGKFSAILPIRTITEDIDGYKYIIDEYDIFAMDSSVGKLCTIKNYTYSKMNEDSTMRVDSVKNIVMLEMPYTVPSYGNSLIQSLLEYCKNEVKYNCMEPRESTL